MSGDRPAPSTQESTAQMIEAYRQGLPGLMEVSNAQIRPNELAQLASQQATSPGYAKLQGDIYDTEGRRLNKIGNEIAGANQQATAQNDLNTINTVGKDLVGASLDAAKIADPEYYKNRELFGNSLATLLSAGGDLTGGELAALERGVNRSNASTGTSFIPSATTVASNAMAFGDASRNKLMQGLQLATGALPTLRSGMDTNLISTGKSSSNSGDNKFLGTQVGAGQQVSGYGNNLLGNIGQIKQQENDINASRRSGFEKTLGFLPKIGFGL